MQLHVNGQPTELPDGATVSMLVTHHTGRELTPEGQGGDGRLLALAVALDGEIVPRSQWHQHPLAEGARVELVTAVQGG